ncbi:MAG: hypothetical protein ACTSYH_00575 [Candidatus Heimdallarchaeaceae archaeon]
MRKARLNWGFIIQILYLCVLVTIIILGFIGVFFIDSDSVNFLQYEGLAALWGLLLSLFFGSFYTLIVKKLPIYKNFIWKIRINSISKRIGYNLTYTIYRKINIKPYDCPIDLSSFRESILNSSQDLHVKKLINQEWRNNSLVSVFQLYSENLTNIECTPNLHDTGEETKVTGFTLSAETEGNFKFMNNILNDNDSLMKSIISTVEHSLIQNRIEWEPPILEIQPLRHFIKDNYWLNQMAEKSIITVHLKDDVIVSLSGEKLTMRLNYDDKKGTVFIDAKYTFPLQQAIATFYGSKD